MTEVNFPPETFDGVATFYSIIHNPRQQHGALMAPIARWLRPGGLLMGISGYSTSRHRSRRTGWEPRCSGVRTMHRPDGISSSRRNWISNRRSFRLRTRTAIPARFSGSSPSGLVDLPRPERVPPLSNVVIMSFAGRLCSLVLLASSVLGCQRVESKTPMDDSAKSVVSSSFDGSKGGDEKAVAGIKLCWCPPGRFVMGSPRSEPERRPGEDQVEVTLTKGFLDGQVRGDAGAVETGHRKAAGRPDGRVARGG